MQSLGRGSTGAVISCTNNDGNSIYAMKISRNKDALILERVILNYLNGQADMSGHIPRVVKLDGISQPYEDYSTFFDVVYKSFTSWNRNTILEVWRIFCYSHSHGIVHCDVRCPISCNIMGLL